MDTTQRMGVGGVEAENKRIILPCVLGNHRQKICNGLQGMASTVCKVVS